MNPTWASFLEGKGALIAAGEVVRLGSSDELAQARAASVICDLSCYGLISFIGVDAQTFLHAQLSSDVRALDTEHCQLATYNTPKGRVLATVLLWRSAEGFFVQAPAAIADSLRQRLSLFILRSKVQASDATERFIRIGIGGPRAAQTLEAAGIDVARNDFSLSRAIRMRRAPAGTTVDFGLRMPGDRVELLFSAVEAAIEAWEALAAAGAVPAGSAPWRWLSVRSGIADIVAETQDQFVPQMLNLELVGGVSFNKGCYPGQEIVARTQYRGGIKRRTFLAHVQGGPEPAPAQAVFGLASPEQALGSIVSAAAAPSGGFDALACLHVELAASSELRLGSPEGPRLELMRLPYELPEHR